ncbi:5-oxoprolinase subunit PxpB [Vibrio sp. SCSIO 43136]|uniref:5-oxoprolinase subunit PxpB n=1 Tax=Vibrio sp. SCSIO 43136 TaxID=2819101 RepID=UPI002075C3F8|nr:5-oxoprolinase subunit PxpB [Vibrio sp. SCSIO 43136]
MTKARIEPIAECSILLTLANEIAPSNAIKIASLAHQIQAELGDVLMNVTPSYTTILVDYLPFYISEAQMCTALETLASRISDQPSTQGRTIELPVYYDVSVGPDLDRYAESRQLSTSNVIEIHTRQNYTVCAMGFAPGFAFLASVEPEIAMPRHATPRNYVPAGSVGIAETQTAVYPQRSPAGWNIIGNCPIPLYRPDSEVISPFEVGDTVQFVSISQQEYLELGGELWEQ